MNSIVTQRFIDCLEYLLEDNVVKSKRQFAYALDYLPQGISEIVNGRRDVTIELIRKAVEVYNMNPGFLFTGSAPLFTGQEKEAEDLKILTVVTDNSNQERIVHVPVPAQAGYVDQFHDPLFVENLPTYTLPDPNFNHGTYRSFDVSGDSMEPVLYHGDKIICSYIESGYWKHAIKNEQIYVFVTTNDIVVKRAVNRIRDGQGIQLVSDNDLYAPYDIPLQDIREIWKVRLKITSRLDLPDKFHHASFGLEEIEDKLDRQNEIIKSLLLQVGGQMPQYRNETSP